MQDRDESYYIHGTDSEASMTAFNGKGAPTQVVTDASPVGPGCILVQEKQGAVAFASRSLSDVER